jgi:transposase
MVARRMILFEKFGQHQPLNRQSERYAYEGGNDFAIDNLSIEAATAPGPIVGAVSPAF